MNTVANEYTRNVLRESRNRVASMALIHQRLYNTPNADEVDFGQYAAGLVEEIRHSYSDSVSGTIHVKANAESCLLRLTQAIPCGLVLNELLSNCYKHAFPGGRGGTIWIGSGKTPDGSGFFLQVEDDGAGIPVNIDIASSDSLGLTIIQSLAGQVEANYELKRRPGGGTYFRMEFQSTNSK
jgi:two-component sensor histidine kinase